MQSQKLGVQLHPCFNLELPLLTTSTG